jgi:hypothetical protein
MQTFEQAVKRAKNQSMRKGCCFYITGPTHCGYHISRTKPRGNEDLVAVVYPHEGVLVQDKGLAIKRAMEQTKCDGEIRYIYGPGKAGNFGYSKYKNLGHIGYVKEYSGHRDCRPSRNVKYFEYPCLKVPSKYYCPFGKTFENGGNPCFDHKCNHREDCPLYCLPEKAKITTPPVEMTVSGPPEAFERLRKEGEKALGQQELPFHERQEWERAILSIGGVIEKVEYDCDQVVIRIRRPNVK